MKDSTYAYDVARNLVQMGRALFMQADIGLRDAERSIMLDENDAEEILAAEQNPTNKRD